MHPAIMFDLTSPSWGHHKGVPRFELLTHSVSGTDADGNAPLTDATQRCTRALRKAFAGQL